MSISRPETKPGEQGASDARRAIGPAVSAVRRRAAVAKRHRSAHATVGSAQAAAIHPHTEQVRGAAVQTVSVLDGPKPQPFRRQEFKDKLRKAILDATPQPKTEAEADSVKDGGAKASQALTGEMQASRDRTVGPMQAAAATDVSPAAQPTSAVAPLQVQPPGPAPAPVPAASVVPASLPAQRLDYSADREPTDRVMAQSDVTQEQLKKGNDPAFGPALESRAAAEKHEAAAQANYRGEERRVQEQAHDQATSALTQGLTGIHARRATRLGRVATAQRGIAAHDAAKREEITARIARIKTETKSKVDAILQEIEDEAPKIFSRGLARAEEAYEAAFEEAKGGIGTWLTTWGSSWDKHIAEALATARAEYMRQVDAAIDEVADLIDAKLAEAKECVSAGRRAVDEFVNGLDGMLRHFGEKARDSVSSDFDAMAAQIDERCDALVSTLAGQYKESFERMSAREEELREANKSLWQRVYDATVGLVKKIIAFKNMLLDTLARAAGVISDIIHDPIGFLGNLVDAVGLGLKNFKSNIATHLKKGLMEWIFGALSGAGLEIPETFDLKGILSLVLQVLGLTYANFRARAAAIVGETVVNALEQAAGVFKIFMTEGVKGLWNFIKEKVSDLKSMVIDAIFGYIKEKVITAGITWIIGLLNPVSAFFKAIKAIYDIVMFFVDHAAQIMELVNAIINSVAAIVKGNITAAAAWVENALAKIIPIAIGFLASLLGLGDPSKPVKEIIEKARSPVNKAIDWVIHGAVKLVKAAGRFVKGLFGKKGTAAKEWVKSKWEGLRRSFDFGDERHTLILTPGDDPNLMIASEPTRAVAIMTGEVDRAAKAKDLVRETEARNLLAACVEEEQKLKDAAKAKDEKIMAMAHAKFGLVLGALRDYGKKYHRRGLVPEADLQEGSIRPYNLQPKGGKGKFEHEHIIPGALFAAWMGLERTSGPINAMYKNMMTVTWKYEAARVKTASDAAKWSAMKSRRAAFLAKPEVAAELKKKGRWKPGQPLPNPPDAFGPLEDLMKDRVRASIAAAKQTGSKVTAAQIEAAASAQMLHLKVLIKALQNRE